MARCAAPLGKPSDGPFNRPFEGVASRTARRPRVLGRSLDPINGAARGPDRRTWLTGRAMAGARRPLDSAHAPERHAGLSDVSRETSVRIGNTSRQACAHGGRSNIGRATIANGSNGSNAMMRRCRGRRGAGETACGGDAQRAERRFPQRATQPQRTCKMRAARSQTARRNRRRPGALKRSRRCAPQSGGRWPPARPSPPRSDRPWPR